MKNYFDIHEYFTDKEIIKILCRKRAIIAKKNHDNHFYRNISHQAKSPHIKNENFIFSLFPPRTQWIRLNKQEREKRNSNTLETNSIQLERTVWREIKRFRKSKIKHPWLGRLLNFTNEIREKVFDDSSKYKISPPRTIPILKNIRDKTYRPLSIYNLFDLIVIGQTSKYLSNCFDKLFSDSSYAFRTGIQKDKIFNHHKAIEDIIKFKNEIGKPLFVTECDIKKFYDCVNHKIVKDHFAIMTEELRQKEKIEIDQHAIYIFKSYLDSFSFNNHVKKNEAKLLHTIGVKDGTIPWVSENELQNIESNIKDDTIGIPQGGAISCLIANILLNHVDKAIEKKSDSNTFYARFCDDMVLMHTDLNKCNELLEIYQNSLKDIKLISHNPKDFSKYGTEFWDENLKSKLPYKWDHYSKNDSSTLKNVPWLSFVGYQIKYNGTIRVRKKSIKKELKKQVSETDKLLKIIRKSARINRKAIKFRLQQRLISMSVSRFKFGSSKISMCWCSGFKVLNKNPNVKNQIRGLDRNREKQLRRLELHLRRLKTPKNKNVNEIKVLKFYGHKYSYHKQFN